MNLINAHQGRLAQIAGKAEPTTRPINAFQARLGMIAGDESVTAVNPPANGYQAYLGEIESTSHAIEDALINNTVSGVYRNDRVTYVAAQRFRGQEQLTEIIFPNVEEIASTAFYYCTNLERIYMPKLRTIGPQAFAGVSKAKIMAFPVLSSVSNGCFGWNSTVTRSELEVLDLGGSDSEASIANNAFVSTSLRVLILRNSSITQLANIGAFLRTPFASDGAGGTIYVPRELISAYQAAVNWSTILGIENNSILSIEGSEYEHNYADGTPVPVTVDIA